MIVVEIFIWIFVFLIVHSYLIYPFYLKFRGSGKSLETNYSSDSYFPRVSIIMAVFNEEQVIEKKLVSIIESSYDFNKIEVLIGSDNSTDGTNDILEKYAEMHPEVVWENFTKRQGKAEIINYLVKKASGSVLILTDANVFFTDDTILALVKPFTNPQIGVVGANIINTNVKSSGISFQEKTYLMNENNIKYLEGVVWGAMIGAFGGCYAIRKELYSPVPKNYYMDDFYITLMVISQGYKTINELKAVCFEDVSNQLSEEFRRKIRISIGNYQNLRSFAHLLKKPWKGYAFAFWSHKVLRWFGPFFIILILLLTLILIDKPFYYNLMILQIGLLIVPFIDLLLRKINIHIILLRFITHFYSMNLALLIGFFKFVKGVNSNVWEPTKRFQK